ECDQKFHIPSSKHQKTPSSKIPRGPCAEVGSSLDFGVWLLLFSIPNEIERGWPLRRASIARLLFSLWRWFTLWLVARSFRGGFAHAGRCLGRTVGLGFRGFRCPF